MSAVRTIAGSRLAACAALTAALCAAGVAFRAQQPAAAITVYKTAVCGCCAKWVDYMRAEGFAVTAIDVEDIAAVKRTYGVPDALAACHTALVDGYVVEGHVPADLVTRLLQERPTLAGLAVPGMPVGSPGMEQPGRNEPYAILRFDRSGAAAVYERR
jgi:hypothetical protein